MGFLPVGGFSGPGLNTGPHPAPMWEFTPGGRQPEYGKKGDPALPNGAGIRFPHGRSEAHAILLYSSVFLLEVLSVIFRVPVPETSQVAAFSRIPR